VLVVNGNVPANSVGELIALAKANPGKLNYASIGTGSTNHLLGEMFRRAAGIDIIHVPYKGNGPGLTALLAGEVQFFFFPAFVDAMLHIRSGRLRALAVADSRRSPAAPDIPTLTELGYELVAPAWFVMVAPAGTPGAIVQRLAAEVQRVNSLDEVKRFLGEQGAEPGNLSPEALAQFIAAEYARYGRMIREAGIKAE
jgi:tripartite-type tricarboxylate transporter receptor subunit TctC